MKKFVRLTTFIIIIAVVSSLVFLGLYTGSNTCNCVLKTYGFTGEQGTNTSGDDDDVQDGNGSDNGTDDGNNDFKHYVFVEDGTATWCSNCPVVGERLKELYDSGSYNFYYVSMISDKSSKAEKRLKDDYNIYAYPVVYIDGGYKAKIGSGVSKEEFADAINDAGNRKVPKINITLNAEFINSTNVLKTVVFLENHETADYAGHLRVYLTEIISRWDEYNKNPYHFGFVDFTIDKNVTIPSKGNASYIDERNITGFEVADLNPEELMIFAVIFNSESVKADSYPDGPEGEFDAHYADGVSATTVVPGGNLPPELGIDLPENGKLHLFGNPVLNTLNKNTILIFGSTIRASASDESGIEKVEFYIDGELVFTDDEPPYEHSFNKINLIRRIIKKHTITVKAYDYEGKSRTSDIDVITILL